MRIDSEFLKEASGVVLFCVVLGVGIYVTWVQYVATIQAPIATDEIVRCRVALESIAADLHRMATK